MKVWTCNDFKGHWPVGAAAVVVAPSREEAKRLLLAELDANGLHQKADIDLQAVPLVPLVRILFDGNY